VSFVFYGFCIFAVPACNPPLFRPNGNFGLNREP
jgi:hypothetical protein